MTNGFWYISLHESKHYWFDLIVRPLKHVDTRKAILEDLKLKEEAEKRSPHSRFVYFFASRPKIRICTEKKPIFEKSTGNLEFYIRIGKNTEPVKVNSQIILSPDIKENFFLEVTDKTLRLYSSPETSETVTIHDFLSDTNYNLDIPTEILYIGSTTDEAKRFLNRTHRGVTDSIYYKGSETHDFFFFSNLFNVEEVFYNEKSRTRTIIKKNSLNLASCKEECVVIENGLILYFNCESQELNKIKETSEYKNMVGRLKYYRGIDRFAYHLQIFPNSSYFKFSSRNRASKYEHNYFHYIEKEEIKTVKCNSEEGLLEALECYR